jgi:hypothetical protein
MCTVALDAVVVPDVLGVVVCVVVLVPLVAGGFSAGGVVVAAGGVSSTGYGLSALMVVSLADIEVSVCFF